MLGDDQLMLDVSRGGGTDMLVSRRTYAADMMAMLMVPRRAHAAR
jgi:hypothetical protein